MVGGEEAIAIAGRVFAQHLAKGKVVGGISDGVSVRCVGPEEDAGVARALTSSPSPPPYQKNLHKVKPDNQGCRALPRKKNRVPNATE
jgi:hypothetical protein